jgi:hypothetical protein
MKRGITCVVLGALLVACGDDGSSTATSATAGVTDITADKDPSISSAGDGVLGGILDFSIGVDGSVNGLDPGDLVGSVGDGWSVRYDKLLASFGGLYAANPAAKSVVRDTQRFVVNLIAVHPRLANAIQVLNVHTGDYGSMMVATPGAEGVSDCRQCADGDLKLMLDGGYSLYIEGKITNEAGQSCAPGEPTDCAPAPEVRFRWGIPGGVRHAECPGFTIQANDTTSITWMVNGDRWLLSGFSPDDESAPRLAQWIADADLDRDGETTLDELQQIKAELLFPPERGYDLSGAPRSIDTAYDFLIAQVEAFGAANGCRRSLPL